MYVLWDRIGSACLLPSKDLRVRIFKGSVCWAALPALSGTAKHIVEIGTLVRRKVIGSATRHWRRWLTKLLRFVLERNANGAWADSADCQTIV